MIRYSKEERRIVQTYIRTMSITEVQRNYRTHFETRISPSKNTIKSLYRKFAHTKNVNDKPRSGRKRSFPTEDFIERVVTSIAENPKTHFSIDIMPLSEKGFKFKALQNSIDSTVIA